MRPRILITLCLLTICRVAFAQNAVIPDYVADPSVSYFDGTYYMYATSDINHGLAQMGPPVVWKSKDLVNWSYKGTLFSNIDFNKAYTYTDAKGAQKTGYFRYWAPGKVLKRNNQYYLYATIVKPDETMGTYLLLADKPEGPFRFNGGTGVYYNQPEKAAEEAKPVAPDIDGDVFADDDGSAYVVWRRRNAAKLNADWAAMAGEKVSILTKRGGYSEGPFMFKRNGLYYYVYTLSGNANYCYAYMMSKNPLGPYTAPAGTDIILRSDIKTRVWGPGHGNVLHIPETDNYLFFYLEYGNGGTTRLVYANKMEFNADGTIKPIQVNLDGTAAMFKSTAPATVKPVGVNASGSREDRLIKVAIDTALDKLQTMASRYSGLDVVNTERISTAKPENAFDGLNSTYWMANVTDTQPWIQADLGAVKNIKSVDLFFVESTLGHTWKLEASKDGKTWQTVKTQSAPVLMSPESAGKIGQARYLKLTILSGAPGLWEIKIY
ncbi:family 43 glycosylhydrolase [Mucilaginibacter sp. HMF5004]|uniref:family 43 glycosylhydrolase n=1 Tax=Mucilaginibacter rivuli TaxID=2857527 RepID=UPI001C5FD90C|nr:family 43 glycosylhydrolase [Mucilaginibacter rivuli]MBW4891603.1 family 43 glycosylhydrolase [Mucilaginibacter rivuli]